MHIVLSNQPTPMMVNQISMYGPVSYGKVQLLFYWLFCNYPCPFGIFFEYYKKNHNQEDHKATTKATTRTSTKTTTKKPTKTNTKSATNTTKKT